MRGNENSYAGNKLQVEVRLPGLVRVNSYVRIQNGKPVKVLFYIGFSNGAG